MKKIDLDRFQYRFQPIKFVNLAVPSPCETKPYDVILNNNRKLKMYFLQELITERQCLHFVCYVTFVCITVT